MKDDLRSIERTMFWAMVVGECLIGAIGIALIVSFVCRLVGSS
jgi:hypothetical protein